MPRFLAVVAGLIYIASAPFALVMAGFSMDSPSASFIPALSILLVPVAGLVISFFVYKKKIGTIFLLLPVIIFIVGWTVSISVLERQVESQIKAELESENVFRCPQGYGFFISWREREKQKMVSLIRDFKNYQNERFAYVGSIEEATKVLKPLSRMGYDKATVQQIMTALDSGLCLNAKHQPLNDFVVKFNSDSAIIH